MQIVKTYLHLSIRKPHKGTLKASACLGETNFFVKTIMGIHPPFPFFWLDQFKFRTLKDHNLKRLKCLIYNDF